MDVFGSTRSRIRRDYALITPDTHVTSPLVGWTNATAVVHISPHLGARVWQYTANLEADSKSAQPSCSLHRFVYVRNGEVDLTVGPPPNSREYKLAAGGFAFLPTECTHELSARQQAQLVVFEKEAEPLDGLAAPTHIVGTAHDIAGEPFMGDPDARLQTLLPVAPEFDMAVNIFTYQPGATLPQVEIHVMEHGLMMLSGMGVYRLSGDYHPVAEGDVIWMASYCPQWFVAMGKQPASYIYYKDIHRELVNCDA